MEKSQVVAVDRDLFDDRKDVGRPVFEDGRRGFKKNIPAHGAEDFLDIVVPDVVAAESYGLVEKALGVAQASVGRLGDQIQSQGADRQTFARGDPRQMFRDLLPRNFLEFEMLAARGDGRRDLVKFRRREDEHRVRRGLLKGFEEGVESRSRNLMDLVDDDDLEPALNRFVFDTFPESADLLNAPA